ncbi:hypothetical protein JCM10207_008570 [Rhodosporidiobolus poonsookiae]
MVSSPRGDAPVAGCGTCKGRRKACDEEWDASGSCKRCLKAGYPCHKDTYKPPRRRRPRKAPAINEPSPTVSASAVAAFLPDPPPLPHAAKQVSGHPSIAPNDSDILALSPSSSLFAASSNPIPPDLIFDLLNTTSASTSTVTPAIAPASNPDPLDILCQTAADQTGATETALELDQFMAWLSSPPEPIATEVTKFSSEWWGFYVSMVDAFFYSIPSAQRNLFLAHLHGITGTTDLGQSGVAAWCCAHFAHHLLPNNPDRRAWEEKADKFYDHGVALLTRSGAAYSLNILLSSIIDLRLAKLDSRGAAAASHLLDLADFFLKASKLAHQINLRLLGGIDSVALRLFIYIDVFRAIATPGRLPLFELVDVIPSAIPIPADGVTSEHLSLHYGLSVDILICFSTIVTTMCRRAEMGPEEIKRVGAEMDAKIRACKTRLPEAAQSSLLLSNIASQEMWRQAALIYLYTGLLRHTPLSRVLRTAFDEMLVVSDSLHHDGVGSGTAPTYSNASLAFPWFLAATVAITEEEKERCLEGIESCGTGCLHRDNKAFILRFWEAVEHDGHAPDWTEFAQREGLSIAFM